jgi:5-methylcytosine-specific restriction enzyme A
MPEPQMKQDALTQKLYANYQTAGKDFGFWASRFLAALKRHGGLAVAKRMLAKPVQAGKTKGFQTLMANYHLDLSVEAVALSTEFSHLFTQAELLTARARLQGLSKFWPKEVPVDAVHPDELPDEPDYWEGAVSKVQVNRYERDRDAREACLKKHGAKCKVCGLNFGEVYGPIGKGFIHVHHVKPLGVMKKQYRLNPKVDLVPVCPNCHAMLHRQMPAYKLEQLLELMKQANKEK